MGRERERERERERGKKKTNLSRWKIASMCLPHDLKALVKGTVEFGGDGI